MATGGSVGDESIHIVITIEVPRKSSSQPHDDEEGQQHQVSIVSTPIFKGPLADWHDFQGLLATARWLPYCNKYRELISKAPGDRNDEELRSVLQKLLPERYDFLYRDRFFTMIALRRKPGRWRRWTTTTCGRPNKSVPSKSTCVESRSSTYPPKNWSSLRDACTSWF